MFGNLLLTALSVIPSNGPVQYLKAIGTTTNASGYDVHTFAAPVDIPQSSVQSVPRISYGFMGLDYSKKYVNWYVPREVVGLEPGSSGDRMTYAGNLYQLESATDWAAQDGWCAVLCVDITNGEHANA